MFVPHRGKDAEFSEVRLATDQLEDALIFVGLEAMGGDQLFGDGNVIAYGHFIVPNAQAALPQRASPAAQRLTSLEIRDPCASSISGPKAATWPAAPSACTTSSGLPPKLPFGTKRKRGRPEK